MTAALTTAVEVDQDLGAAIAALAASDDVHRICIDVCLLYCRSKLKSEAVAAALDLAVAKTAALAGCDAEAAEPAAALALLRTAVAQQLDADGAASSSTEAGLWTALCLAADARLAPAVSDTTLTALTAAACALGNRAPRTRAACIAVARTVKPSQSLIRVHRRAGRAFNEPPRVVPQPPEQAGGHPLLGGAHMLGSRKAPQRPRPAAPSTPGPGAYDVNATSRRRPKPGPVLIAPRSSSRLSSRGAGPRYVARRVCRPRRRCRHPAPPT